MSQGANQLLFYSLYTKPVLFYNVIFGVTGFGTIIELLLRRTLVRLKPY